MTKLVNRAENLVLSPLPLQSKTAVRLSICITASSLLLPKAVLEWPRDCCSNHSKLIEKRAKFE